MAQYALILAGGSGTRLWPLSTADMPKQLVPLFGGKSLLQMAVERLEGLIPAERVYICACESLREGVLQALPDMPASHFIGEPAQRDTLSAVALGSMLIHAQDVEAQVVVLSADQLIHDMTAFQMALDTALKASETEGSIVTLGVRPDYPATGYGYLALAQQSRTQLSTGSVWQLDAFMEKPDLVRAEQYVSAGPERYLWNAGCFIWRTDTLLEALRCFCPVHLDLLAQIIDIWQDEERREDIAHMYARLQKISVDYALMEPASLDERFDLKTVRLDTNWLDVGSWPTYAQALGEDVEGNAIEGQQLHVTSTKRSAVVSTDPDHLLVVHGLEDMVVVHTPKTTLVCRREDAQEVKNLHAKIAEAGFDEYL